MYERVQREDNNHLHELKLHISENIKNLSNYEDEFSKIHNSGIFWTLSNICNRAFLK